MSAADPLTHVEDLIWSVLESSAEWCSLVKPANRVKFTSGNADPLLNQRQDADLPSVYLFHAPWQFNAQTGSGLCTIRANYTLAIDTGELRTGCANADPNLTSIESPEAIVGINRVLWETFRAFEAYRTTNRNPLSFVVPGSLQIVDATTTLRGEEGIKPGFSAVCGVTALLKWTRSEVLAT